MKQTLFKSSCCRRLCKSDRICGLTNRLRAARWYSESQDGDKHSTLHFISSFIADTCPDCQGEWYCVYCKARTPETLGADGVFSLSLVTVCNAGEHIVWDYVLLTADRTLLQRALVAVLVLHRLHRFTTTCHFRCKYSLMIRAEIELPTHNISFKLDKLQFAIEWLVDILGPFKITRDRLGDCLRSLVREEGKVATIRFQGFVTYEGCFALNY